MTAFWIVVIVLAVVAIVAFSVWVEGGDRDGFGGY